MTKEQVPQGNDIDISLDNNETPSDTLHGIAQSKINKPTSEWESSDIEHIGKIVKHPKVSPDTVSKLYNHVFPKSDVEIDAGHEAPENNEALEHIFDSGKASLADAEDLLNRTHKNVTRYNGGAINSAAEHPGLSDEFKETKTKEFLDNTNAQYGVNFKHKPAFLHGLLMDRPLPEPEQGNMTESQKATNIKVKKIDKMVFGGLKTAKHTPEEQDQSVRLLTSDAPYGFNGDFKDETVEFIGGQKDLTTKHLDTFINAYGNDSNIVEAVIDHPNVDPVLVTKVAKSNQQYDGWSDPRGKALASSKLPEAVRQQIIDAYNPTQPETIRTSPTITYMLSNEHLPAEDVAKIFEKTKTNHSAAISALSHPNVNPSLIQGYYDQDAKKSASFTKDILRLPKTSPAILRDIVGTNKNADTSIEAMSHKNADITVVETGLKRRMKAVQEAAQLNPLVAHKTLRDKLKNGTIEASTILFDKKIKEAFGDITDQDINDINERYKGPVEDADKHSREHALVKHWLATDERVPAAVQKQNRRDLINDYNKTSDSSLQAKDQTPEGEDVNEFIIKLADQTGDADVKAAILARPWSVAAKLDFKNDNYDAEFLDKIEPALEQIHKEKTNAQLEGGKKPYLSYLRPLVQNPNCSQALFDKITTSPDFLDNAEIMNDGVSRWDASKENRTIFDARYGETDEAEKRAGFQKLANIDSKGARWAMLNSKQAPDDLWNKSFAEYDDKKKKEFLHNSNHFISKLDEVNLNKALNGGFNHTGGNGYGGGNGRELQTEILGKLNSSNPMHVNAIKGYISRVYGTNTDAANNTGHMNVDNFVGAIDATFWKSDAQAGDGVVKHALATDRYLGALMAFDYETTDYSKRTQLPEKLQAQFSFDSNPDAYFQRWNALLHKPNGYHQDDLRQIAEAGGNFDFLANLPGDEAHGGHVRAAALRRGLFSQAGIQGILNQDPTLLGASLSGMAPQIRAKTTQNILNNPTLDQNAVNGILESLNHQSVLPPERVNKRSSYSGKMSDHDWQTTLGNVDKVVNHAITTLNAGQVSRALVADIAGKLTHDDRLDDKFTIPQKKEVVGAVTDKIIASNMSPENKSEIISMMASSVDVELQSTKLKDAVGQLAVQHADLETLIQMKEDGQATKSVTNAINKSIKNIHTLNHKQIHSLTKLLKNGEIGDKNASRILDGLSVKLDSVDPEDQNLAMDTLRSVANVACWEDSQALATQAIDHVIKASNSLNPELAAQATNARVSRFGDMSGENQKKAFLSLPSDLAEGQSIESDSALKITNVNDPEVLLSATHGWKFEKIIDSAYRNIKGLSENTAEVLSNRLIESDLGDPYKISFATALTQGTTAAHQENAVKVIRALGPKASMEAMSKLEMRFDVRATSSVATFATHAFDYIKGQYETKKSMNPVVDIVNISDTIYQLSHIAEVSKKAAEYADGDGTDGLAKIVSKSIELLKDVHESMISKIENHTETLDANHVDTYSSQMRSMLAASANTISKMDHNASMAMLSVSDYQNDSIRAFLTANRNLDPKERDNLVNALKDNEESTSNFLHEWAKQSTLEDNQWHEAFTAQPKLKFKISSFRNITPTVFDAIDMSEMLNNPDESQVNLFADNLNQLPWSFKKEEATKILDKTLPAVLDKMAKNNNYDNNIGHSLYQFVTTSVGLYPDNFSSDKLASIASILESNPKKKADLYLAAAVSGAGGNDSVKKAIKLAGQDEGDIHPNDSVILNLARNAKLDKESVNELFTRGYRGDQGRMARSLSSNKNIDADSVKMLYNWTKSKSAPGWKQDADAIFKNLVQHPGIDFDSYKGIYEYFKEDQDDDFFVSGKQFNQAFLNREHGGQLLRSLPSKVPDRVEGVDQSEDKLPKTFEFSPAKNRLKEVLPQIPAEGIHWSAFKKLNPKASNWNEIKGVFMSKPDDIARPEDFVKAMKDQGGDFHLTFSYWNGAQRHNEKGNNKPNMVVQLNTGEGMENELKRDPKLFAFFQLIQKAANRVGNHEGHQIGGHPVTPFCASWVRVDTTGGKNGWVIEEFQSDFSASLQGQVDMIKVNHPDGLTLEGQHFHPDEMKVYAKKIEKILSGWHEASANGMEDFARKQGVKTLYLHGEGVRSKLSGMDNRDAGNPIWMQHMYNKHPKNTGWDTCSYTDYPNYSNRFAEDCKSSGKSLSCWKKDLK